MSISLTQLLDLVGKLDDALGPGTPRERFRKFLKENVKEVATVRDYIGECLRNSGEQYSCALQDLVNHLGGFLEFEVVFGRYRGVPGQIGFDGFWKSPADFSIVVESKTTEVYTIKTSTLVGYIDGLISERKIPDRDHALGLYVIGRPDPELQQLRNTILAEKRTRELRIISIESLLSLADLLKEYDVGHKDILSVLKLSGPDIDPVVDMMVRLVAQGEGPPPVVKKREEEEKEMQCWLTPVKGNEAQTAEEIIQTLVGEEKIYAFGERTPGRRSMKAEDLICFYSTGEGVVAHATVVSRPEYKPHPKVYDSKRYPWTFLVKDARLYLDNPVVIDAPLRAELDSFRGRDTSKYWAWLVQATRRITGHDFQLLTRGKTQESLRPGG